MRNMPLCLRGVLLFIVALAMLFVGAPAQAEQKKLVIGIPLQPSSALVIVAREKGLFAKHGLDVEYVEYISGKRALLDGLLQDKVDLVTSADVPVVKNFFDNSDLRIVAELYDADNVNSIVARKDSGIFSPPDLNGKRIGIQKASAVHYFFHLYSVYHGLDQKSFDYFYMKGSKLPQAIYYGEIDAFSMREPYVGQAIKLLGRNAVVLKEPGLYSQSELLVGRQDFLMTHKGQVVSVLRALIDAEKFVVANVDEAADIVAEVLCAGCHNVEKLFKTSRFYVSLDQRLFASLEGVARWSVQEGLVLEDKYPNFYEAIDTSYLSEVDPRRVSFID